MKVLRRIGKKGTGGIAAAAALAGLMMFVVLPALASTPGSLVPPASSPNGVTPVDVQTGGQDNDCSLFYPNGSTLHAFYVDNPKSKSYTDSATGATFTLTVNPTPSTGWPAYANGKYLSFTSTGAAVVDIGINGGNDTTHYNYSTYLGQPNGFTRSDGYLHAGAQSVNSSGNPTQLYSYSHVAFCYGTTAAASGKLFSDVNHNGVRDAGESGLSSKTVRLYSGSNLVASAVSGADGSYQFASLTPGGTYKVCVVGTDGKETLPTTATSGSAACSGSGEGAVGYGFTANTNVTGLDFGLAPVAAISGTAFLDTNGDGVNNTGDSPAGSLTVTLYSGSGSSLGTATTAANGTYSFANQFANDTYRVCISKPTGGSYTQTAPSSGAACTASGQAANGYPVTLGAGGRTGADFGFEPWGSASGTVYNDLNQDGINNDGSPQQGWTVNLYAGTSLVKTTTSAADGSYSITLPFTPGTAYTLCESAPSGTWGQSEPLPSTATVCHSGELPKGYSFTPTLPAQVVTGNDFGNAAAVACNGTGTGNYQVQLASCSGKVGGFVFNSGTTTDGKLFVSLWTGDETQGPTPLVEKIVWPYDPTGGQNQFNVRYTDVFPFELANLKAMPYCKLDPRDLGTDPSGLTLLPAYQNDANKGQVLPGTDTSCLILTTEATGTTTPAAGAFSVFVFSDIDGLRTNN